MARVFISHSSRDNKAADKIKSWLQEHGFAAPFLDFDKHLGIPPGADWERTLYREINNSEAVIIIQTANWLDSKWCFAEFTQARALGKAIFPIIETPDGDTLISPDIQALDLQQDRKGGLERLARELTAVALEAQGGFPWVSGRAPYPGLLAYQEEDAAIYFGRDDDTRRLNEQLNARRAQGGARLTVVLGASGSGKSSLIRAGVIPRLKRAGKSWIVLPPMRPTTQPLVQLARTLMIATEQGGSWQDLRDRLLSDDTAIFIDELTYVLRKKHKASEAHILLPIDQAEELFTIADPEQSAQVLDIISTTLKAEVPVIPLLTLRSDHLENLQAARSLTVQLDEFSLGPMPLARIPQIIEGPARVAGIGLDDALVHQAAHDAETDDALPLLAFTLRELYDHSAGDNFLSLEEYNAMGDKVLGITPLENAVRRRADAVLAEANPDAEKLTALKDAFVPAMVRINSQGDYVRAATHWDALPAKAHPLLESLANARLLVIRQEDDVKVVEVTHEALLRKWPLLRGWLDDASEFLQGKQQLEADIRDWSAADSKDRKSALLTGLKLNRASMWLDERPHQLSDKERKFIQASVNQDKAVARRRKIQGAMFTGVIAMFAVFAGFQWLETQQSLTERVLDQQRFIWMDLGGESEELERLTEIASEEGVPAEKFVEKEQVDGYDCQTGVPGFRRLYCSVRLVINLSRAETIAGMPIFRQDGPHGNDLNLKSESTFGHYNPEFLTWLDKFIIPESGDQRFNSLKERAYRSYIADGAKALYYTHQILFSSEEEFAIFLQNYKSIRDSEDTHRGIGGMATQEFDIESLELIRSDYEMKLALGRPLPDQYFENKFFPISDFLVNTKARPAPDARHWYLTNTAGGFWVRRSIDGTEAQIFELVVKVLRYFEPNVLAEVPAWNCRYENCF